MVPAKDAGIELYVRNKRPDGTTQFSPEKTVVFVHGATYPAHTAFDLQLAGQSWMDFIAARGFDVYLLDLRGYGKSTRPKEMDQPAEATTPSSTPRRRGATSAPSSITCYSGAASRRSTSWAGRGAPAS